MENLIKERILLKQLIKVNPAYQDLFSARITEIKYLINNDVEYKQNYDNVFSLYSLELAEKITKSAMENMRDLLNQMKNDPTNTSR